MRSYLFTVLAFAALLLGVTTACNRDPIPIEVLEKELVGMWWDEYEYHDVTEDGYHSSTEADDGRAWYFKSYNGASVYRLLPKGASQLRVRPALAF